MGINILKSLHGSQLGLYNAGRLVVPKGIVGGDGMTPGAGALGL